MWFEAKFVAEKIAVRSFNENYISIIYNLKYLLFWHTKDEEYSFQPAYLVLGDTFDVITLRG